MNTLVIGSTGMLGQKLYAELMERGYPVTGVARQLADVSLDIQEHEALNAVLSRLKPDLIINTAACVNLQECENSPKKAYCINSRPAAILADYTKRTGAYLIQISTDHFFTDDQNAKHSEEAPVTLLNEYARSKYAAESFATLDPSALIVRTNIVGFRHQPANPTFLEWALKTMNTTTPMTLYHDFYTSSIDVTTFSKALADLIPKRPSGRLNLASSEVSSKKAFIEALADQLGVELNHAVTGSVREHNVIPRAESLGLDVSKAENILGYTLPGLQNVVTQLVSEHRQFNKQEQSNYALS